MCFNDSTYSNSENITYHNIKNEIYSNATLCYTFFSLSLLFLDRLHYKYFQGSKTPRILYFKKKKKKLIEQIEVINTDS